MFDFPRGEDIIWSPKMENGCSIKSPRVKDPRRYLEAIRMHYQGTKDILNEYSDVLSEMHGRCLNIGCRAGNVTKEIILPKLPKDCRLVGADDCECMLEYAKNNCQIEKRLSFSNINLADRIMPKDEVGQYNSIVSFYYLHTFPNLKRTLRNITRLLKSGGQGLIMFLSHHDIFDLYLAYRVDPNYQEYMKDVFFQLSALYGCPNAAEILQHELTSIGLQVIQCSLKAHHITYDNIAELENSLMSMDPFVDRMPSDLGEQYKKAITTDYLKNKRKNGKIVDSYKIVIAQFKKI